MKSTAFALALLLGTAAFAQAGDGSAAYEGDGLATTAYETEGSAAAASGTGLTGDFAATVAALVQAGNEAPRRDARGIAVISDPATVPAGWNGTAGAAMGGPELDPATGAPAAAETYPACTAAVTDNCVQTYEKGRRSD